MRDVVLWIGISLDGFTSGVDERLDWLVPHATTPDAEAVFRRLRERCDTVLVGRVNYEGFLEYWPKVKDDPKAAPTDVAISRWLDDVPKVVFSKTLREVNWKNARLARGTAAEDVAALKREPGKDIIIQNSTRLAQSLLAAGLVDELQMMVVPVILGKGRALFSGLPNQIDLGPAELTRFDNGTFAVVTESSTHRRSSHQRISPVSSRVTTLAGLACALMMARLAAAEPAVRTPQVMILGTYHLANSSRNVVKNAMRDTLAPDRQREIAEVVKALARFRPTVIALEVEPDGRAELERAYREFQDGHRQLSAKETEQLGFRLAKTAGLTSFCLFDYQNGYPYAGVVAFLRKNGRQGALARLETDNANAAVAAAERDKRFSVAQLLALGNSDAVVRAMHWSELFMIDAADERESPGPTVLASWYERNIRMFSRLRGCIKSRDDRVLVIVGWGHVKILRDLVRDSVDLGFVSPLRYLPEPPPPVKLPANERTGLFGKLEQP